MAGIENQLFTWQEWEDSDTGIINFQDCILKVPIGPYGIGHQVPVIVMDYSNSRIEIYDNPHSIEHRQFQLAITIGEEINGKAPSQPQGSDVRP